MKLVLAALISLAAGSAVAGAQTDSLKAENLVADCRDIPDCAQLLAPDDEAVSGLSDEAQLRVAALRTTLAVANGYEVYGRGFVPCVHDSIAGVMAAFQRRFPRAVEESSCSMSPPGIRPDSHLIKTGTDGRAFSLAVRSVEIHGDVGTTTSDFLLGPLDAIGYTCRFRRISGRWIPVSCRMIWIA